MAYVKELNDLLSGIPSDLRDLYSRTLYRPGRTQVRDPIKLKRERYVMFQIIAYSRSGFPLYELLAAAIFLTTGKDGTSNLAKLSWDQMHRRLYSRSAGLLESPGFQSNRPGLYTRSAGAGLLILPPFQQDNHGFVMNIEPTRGSYRVNFIHQTVKEYIYTKDLNIKMVHDLGDEFQSSGFLLILRYLASLLAESEQSPRRKPYEQFFATSNIKYYAQKAEEHESHSARAILEPCILRPREDQQSQLFVNILCGPVSSPPAEIADSMRGSSEVQRLLLEAHLCLQISFWELYQEHRQSLSQEDLFLLLGAAVYILGTGAPRISADRRSRMGSSILETLLQSDLEIPTLETLPEQFEKNSRRFNGLRLQI